MHNSVLENQLIVNDISDVMQDYVSIQLDIDETRVKAAAIVAQKIDITRVIGKEAILRAIEPNGDEDEGLKELIIPALCYYTYSRLLKMFQGNYTDSGLVIDKEATDKNIAKSIAVEMASVGDVFMVEVIEYLKEENPQVDDAEMTKQLSPKVRVFGGKEHRASN